jgi:hypothetical protein
MSALRFGFAAEAEGVIHRFRRFHRLKREERRACGWGRVFESLARAGDRRTDAEGTGIGAAAGAFGWGLRSAPKTPLRYDLSHPSVGVQPLGCLREDRLKPGLQRPVALPEGLRRVPLAGCLRPASALPGVGRLRERRTQRNEATGGPKLPPLEPDELSTESNLACVTPPQPLGAGRPGHELARLPCDDVFVLTKGGDRQQ